MGAVLLGAENRILGSLGDPELHDTLGLDLDRFTGAGLRPTRALRLTSTSFPIMNIRHTFTLIKLLMVIAVIAILATLLLL